MQRQLYINNIKLPTDTLIDGEANLLIKKQWQRVRYSLNNTPYITSGSLNWVNIVLTTRRESDKIFGELLKWNDVEQLSELINLSDSVIFTLDNKYYDAFFIIEECEFTPIFYYTKAQDDFFLMKLSLTIKQQE